METLQVSVAWPIRYVTVEIYFMTFFVVFNELQNFVAGELFECSHINHSDVFLLWFHHHWKSIEM